jgi:hypothetical protein
MNFGWRTTERGKQCSVQAGGKRRMPDSREAILLPGKSCAGMPVNEARWRLASRTRSRMRSRSFFAGQRRYFVVADRGRLGATVGADDRQLPPPSDRPEPAGSALRRSRAPNGVWLADISCVETDQGWRQPVDGASCISRIAALYSFAIPATEPQAPASPALARQSRPRI